MENFNTPLVSIIMATYNGSKYIKEQIESILNQDYANFELIVIDDCSQDNTVDILREYASKDKRICLYPSEINKGVVKTFEYGLSLAKGDYIALSDQDDIFDTNKISTLVSELENNPKYDLAYSDLRLIDNNNRIITNSMWAYQKLNPQNGKPLQQVAYANFITGCSLMLRKKLLKSALPFPQNAIIHDWWLAVIASSENNGGILKISKPLLSYRQHGYNVIGAHSGKFSSALQRVPNLEKRVAWYKRNMDRITGYLALKTIWTTKDLNTLYEVEKCFELLIKNKNLTLRQRLMLLPARLQLINTQNTFHKLDMLLYTIFPRLIDILQKSFPEIGSKRK